jgi:hypothetical protein
MGIASSLPSIMSSGQDPNISPLEAASTMHPTVGHKVGGPVGGRLNELPEAEIMSTSAAGGIMVENLAEAARNIAPDNSTAAFVTGIASGGVRAGPGVGSTTSPAFGAEDRRWGVGPSFDKTTPLKTGGKDRVCAQCGKTEQKCWYRNVDGEGYHCRACHTCRKKLGEPLPPDFRPRSRKPRSSEDSLATSTPAGKSSGSSRKDGDDKKSSAAVSPSMPGAVLSGSQCAPIVIDDGEEPSMRIAEKRKAPEGDLGGPAKKQALAIGRDALVGGDSTLDGEKTATEAPDRDAFGEVLPRRDDDMDTPSKQAAREESAQDGGPFFPEVAPPAPVKLSSPPPAASPEAELLMREKAAGSAEHRNDLGEVLPEDDMVTPSKQAAQEEDAKNGAPDGGPASPPVAPSAPHLPSSPPPAVTREAETLMREKAEQIISTRDPEEPWTVEGLDELVNVVVDKIESLGPGPAEASPAKSSAQAGVQAAVDVSGQPLAKDPDSLRPEKTEGLSTAAVSSPIGNQAAAAQGEHWLADLFPQAGTERESEAIAAPLPGGGEEQGAAAAKSGKAKSPPKRKSTSKEGGEKKGRGSKVIGAAAASMMAFGENVLRACGKVLTPGGIGTSLNGKPADGRGAGMPAEEPGVPVGGLPNGAPREDAEGSTVAVRHIVQGQEGRGEASGSSAAASRELPLVGRESGLPKNGQGKGESATLREVAAPSTEVVAAAEQPGLGQGGRSAAEKRGEKRKRGQLDGACLHCKADVSGANSRRFGPGGVKCLCQECGDAWAQTEEGVKWAEEKFGSKACVNCGKKTTMRRKGPGGGGSLCNNCWQAWNRQNKPECFVWESGERKKEKSIGGGGRGLGVAAGGEGVSVSPSQGGKGGEGNGDAVDEKKPGEENRERGKEGIEDRGEEENEEGAEEEIENGGREEIGEARKEEDTESRETKEIEGGREEAIGEEGTEKTGDGGTEESRGRGEEEFREGGEERTEDAEIESGDEATGKHQEGGKKLEVVSAKKGVRGKGVQICPGCERSIPSKKADRGPGGPNTLCKTCHWHWLYKYGRGDVVPDNKHLKDCPYGGGRASRKRAAPPLRVGLSVPKGKKGARNAARARAAQTKSKEERAGGTKGEPLVKGTAEVAQKPARRKETKGGKKEKRAPGGSLGGSKGRARVKKARPPSKVDEDKPVEEETAEKEAVEVRGDATGNGSGSKSGNRRNGNGKDVEGVVSGPEKRSPVKGKRSRKLVIKNGGIQNISIELKKRQSEDGGMDTEALGRRKAAEKGGSFLAQEANDTGEDWPSDGGWKTDNGEGGSEEGSAPGGCLFTVANTTLAHMKTRRVKLLSQLKDVPSAEEEASEVKKTDEKEGRNGKAPIFRGLAHRAVTVAVKQAVKKVDPEQFKTAKPLTKKRTLIFWGEEVKVPEGVNIGSFSAAIYEQARKAADSSVREKQPKWPKPMWRADPTLRDEERCMRSDGRGWRCGRPRHPGYSMCEHHVRQPKLREKGKGKKGAARGLLRRAKDGVVKVGGKGRSRLAVLKRLKDVREKKVRGVRCVFEKIDPICFWVTYWFQKGVFCCVWVVAQRRWSVCA